MADASARVFAMSGKDLIEFFRHNKGEVFEVILKCFVGLVEPELIEVENAGFVGIEPDGITFGFAEFAAGNLIDDKWARVAIGSSVFEALDEVDTRGAVAVLVGTAKLQSDVVGTEKMEEIVALDEGVAKFGIRDAGATFADAFLDELAVE